LGRGGVELFPSCLGIAALETITDGDDDEV
jgi:hypothetical protein